MTRIRSFVSLTLMGGVLVILPVTVFILLFRWILTTVTDIFAPISEPVLEHFPLHPMVADLLVILALLGLSFVIGLMLRTTVGSWVHQKLDGVMIKVAPGYRSIREMIYQLLGDSESSVLKGDVVIARILGRDNPTSVTGIVTSRHGNGMLTVYVPTAPVPTSGFVYHLPEDCVDVLRGVSVEQAMRTVISCGSGTGALLQKVETERIRAAAVDVED